MAGNATFSIAGSSERQLTELEHEAVVRAAQERALPVRQPAHLPPAERDRAGVGQQDAREAVQQRGLAGAGRTHDGERLPVGEVDVDPGERGRRAEALDQAARGQSRGGGVHAPRFASATGWRRRSSGLRARARRAPAGGPASDRRMTTPRRRARRRRRDAERSPRLALRAEKGPPAHPPELTCPCCLPALGEFSEMTPHEGSGKSLTQPCACRNRRPRAVQDAAMSPGRDVLDSREAALSADCLYVHDGVPDEPPPRPRRQPTPASTTTSSSSAPARAGRRPRSPPRSSGTRSPSSSAGT